MGRARGPKSVRSAPRIARSQWLHFPQQEPSPAQLLAESSDGIDADPRYQPDPREIQNG